MTEATFSHSTVGLFLLGVTRTLNCPPHDQTIEEVLMQTLSLLAGKEVGDGQRDEGGENEAPRALHADHHRRRRLHTLQQMLLCMSERTRTHRRPSGRPGFPAR